VRLAQLNTWWVAAIGGFLRVETSQLPRTQSSCNDNAFAGNEEQRTECATKSGVSIAVDVSARLLMADRRMLVTSESFACHDLG
jgi:hypothetical protein